jgi:hypothetical protein
MAGFTCMQIVSKRMIRFYTSFGPDSFSILIAITFACEFVAKFIKSLSLAKSAWITPWVTAGKYVWEGCDCIPPSIPRSVAVIRMYALRFPHWFTYEVVSSWFTLVRMLLTEDDRKKKLRAALWGLLDGLRGRMGEVR